jgi:hypothetical protein
MNETVQLVSDVVDLVTRTGVQIVALYILVSFVRWLGRTLKKWNP